MIVVVLFFSLVVLAASVLVFIVVYEVAAVAAPARAECLVDDFEPLPKDASSTIKRMLLPVF